MDIPRPIVLIRGGGDLASGVAVRLHRTGLGVVVTEIEQPLALRRGVSFAQAIYAGETYVEEVHGAHVRDMQSAIQALENGSIPVLIDPEARTLKIAHPDVLIDARMRKRPPEIGKEAARLVIGLGPGFTAGADCHAVIETNRGHDMGRVIWDGSAEADSGVPEPVKGYDVDRALRAPVEGELRGGLEIGAIVETGEVLATVGDAAVLAPFNGALRGILHDGLVVSSGMKIGDLDPRGVSEYCFTVSDKSLAVGGGALEAIISQPDVRRMLGD